MDILKMSNEQLKTILEGPGRATLTPTQQEKAIDVLYERIGHDAYYKWSREIDRNG